MYIFFHCWRSYRMPVKNFVRMVAYIAAAFNWKRRLGICVQILHFLSNPAFSQPKYAKCTNTIQETIFLWSCLLDCILLLVVPCAHHCTTSSSVKLVQATKLTDWPWYFYLNTRRLVLKKTVFLRGRVRWIWVWSTRLIWYVCRLWDMVLSWRFER